MKNALLICLGALFSLSALASPLSPEQALTRAGNNGLMRAPSKRGNEAKLIYTSVSERGVNEAYIFNYSSGGFAVLSADDVAYPVLGYSDRGTIDPDNLAPQLKWWLEEYGRQIEWAKMKGRNALNLNVTTRTDLAPIAPLVKTKWDQDTPYNDLCPIPKTVDGRPYTGGKHAYTGCVATAMAQLMKYFSYPSAGEGTIQYTPSRTGYTFDRMTWNLSKHPFDWDNMLNIYSKDAYTQVQGEAVANLMKSCGVSVQMAYGLDASGAAGLDIANALRKYFKYSDNCRSEHRAIYSSEAWAQMIYDNLKNVGPVIVNGQSPSDGGHSFICDGYDGNGFYHFNWGWSGISDGYFLLEALNPDAQGIGGYSGGFNFSQNAIIGAQPPVEGENGYDNPVRVYQYGAATGSVSGKTLTFGVRDYYILGWGNTSDRKMNVNIGAIIEKKNDSSNRQIVKGCMSNGRTTFDTFQLTAYGYYSPSNASPEIALPSLDDGEYKVILASYDNDCNNKEWVPVASPWGYPNYVNITVDGGKYVVTDLPIAQLKLNKVEITSDLYYGRYFKIKANISNNSDMELTGYFSPALYSGNDRKFYGESVGISINAGETVDYEWVSKLSAEPGVPAPTKDTEYTLGLYNPDVHAQKEVYGYFGNVILNPTPTSSPRLSITEFEILGEKVDINFDGRDISTTLVSDPDNVEVKFSYKDNLGYFDGIMKLSLSYRLNGDRVVYPVIDEIKTSQPFLTTGESDTITAHFIIPDPIPGAMYQVDASYTLNSKWNTLGAVGFITGLSGINDIVSDYTNPGKKEYYNLQGQKVYNPSKGDILIEKCGSDSKKIIF
ncbi:hypothetical protein HDR70_01505 [bacterium]|nr:hypothetical protein [bacterium]